MAVSNLTNKQFCYWLQGYFEISSMPLLNKERLGKINLQLDNIAEPLGLYTSWLKKLVTNIEESQYCPNLIAFFTPLITKELNHIFIHEIDTTYDTPHSEEYLLKIHNGETI